MITSAAAAANITAEMSLDLRFGPKEIIMLNVVRPLVLDGVVVVPGGVDIVVCIAVG